MALYLGLDCGGTKTRAMVLDEAGKVVFDQRSGPANLSTTTWEMIESSLRHALAGVPAVQAACGCFAGLLTDDQAAKATALLADLTHCTTVTALPDFHAAWEIAKGQGDLLVIAGTGVLVCSAKDGEIVKSGGGGILFGDHGSTASIGRNALLLTMVNAPVFPPTQRFLDAVEKTFKSRNNKEVVAQVYSSPTPGRDFASMAEIVVKEADSAPYARSAVDDAMSRLAEAVTAHITVYLEKPAGTIVLAGGLWKLGGSLAARFQELLGKPGWSAVRIECAPVYGACRLAMKRP